MHVLTAVALSVLLSWNASTGTFVASVELDPARCETKAAAIRAAGYPVMCLAKSCTDMLASALAGWHLECFDPQHQPVIQSTPKPNKGVM